MVVQPNTVLLMRARRALGLTQRQLAERIGSSHRTVVRWEAGQSFFDVNAAAKVAAHVHPLDRQLAADLLALGGQTLESAGLEAPPPPPAPPAPSVAPEAPPPATPPAPAAPSRELLEALLEAVVCAAADQANAPPRSVRGGVLLVLRRAAELGLDVGAVARAGLLDPERATEA